MLWTRPPIVSWFPDVVPNVYWVAAVYDKLPRGHHGGLPPENRAYGKSYIMSQT
jgi:hypothetical protein